MRFQETQRLMQEPVPGISAVPDESNARYFHVVVAGSNITCIKNWLHILTAYSELFKGSVYYNGVDIVHMHYLLAKLEMLGAFKFCLLLLQNNRPWLAGIGMQVALPVANLINILRS